MQTKNLYNLPIDISNTTSVSEDGIAHIGDLVNSVDYDAPEGVHVLAALDGVVISVKDDSKIGGVEKKYENDGNFIEILHINDEVSEYEHLCYKSAKVKVGDKIKAGQQIAKVGNTGWSECPHLHFMVYPKSKKYKTLKIKWKKYVQYNNK